MHAVPHRDFSILTSIKGVALAVARKSMGVRLLEVEKMRFIIEFYDDVANLAGKHSACKKNVCISVYFLRANCSGGGLLKYVSFMCD